MKHFYVIPVGASDNGLFIAPNVATLTTLWEGIRTFLN